MLQMRCSENAARSALRAAPLPGRVGRHGAQECPRKAGSRGLHPLLQRQEAAVGRVKLEMHNAAARRLMMFIQTYHTDGTGPTFRAERREDGEGARPARPSPAAFLRCNLDLTPASLARRSRGRPAGAGRGDAPPVPASPLACRRGRPEAPTAPPRARTAPKCTAKWPHPGHSGGGNISNAWSSCLIGGVQVTATGSWKGFVPECGRV
ncbi:uncharacterized protein LOC144369842 [Ictidomys tridecemlineatus]